MKVPLLDLRRQNAPLAGRLNEAAARVLASGHYIGGPEVEQFETALAAKIGVRHAIGVSSGTDALLLALMTLGIGPGDEVICPAFTFFATGGCVARVGATPVFCDSLEDGFNLDPADARRRVTARTKAIVPVHLYGQCAGMDDILALGREHNLAVIEDAAQALGATYKGRQAGSMAEFGAYSFYPSKNLGGFGDSGLLVTSDDDLAARARALRNHGAEQRYFHKQVGGNFRMDPMQAALLAVKLDRLDEYGARRAGNAAYYTRALCDLPQVALPAVLPDRGHIWNQYTLRIASGRDQMRAHLTSMGIGSEIYYPLPLHLQKCFALPGAQPGPLPCAERLSRECLSIPIYPELEPAELDAVAAAIRTGPLQ